MSNARINELEKLITKHKALYYQGRATISDEKYDQLEIELQKLDPHNPVLTLVGTDAGVFDKVPHAKKMLSLDKTYKAEDLESFLKLGEVVSVFKIDGSSCSILYSQGRLKLAKTRGDGSRGENITEKVKFIEDIPKTITSMGEIEVRGEIYCDLSGFQEISQEMLALGLEAPNSQRNIVAGLLGRKEHISLAKNLRFQAFDVLGETFKTEINKIKNLKKQNFKTPSFELHKDIESIRKKIEEAKEFMLNGDYLIDGLVFVYNDQKLHEELGETSHHPRYKIAYKFQGDTKTTKIKSITWQVSRNGRLTPVAEIEPTELSGAIINRVTLHNLGQVRAFQLKVDDQIEIVRSGEVIPKFLSVIESSKNKWEIPKECPSCSSQLEEETIWLKCVNEFCPAKQLETILHWIKQVNIEDLSDKRLQEMINSKMVVKISDLYRLDQTTLLRLDKVKEKMADKIIKNIEKTKKMNLITFLSAIGLEGISRTKAEKIVSNGFNSIEKIQSMTVEQLLSIEGFAEKSSVDIINSIQSKKTLIQEILGVGIELEAPEVIEGGVLEGKKFCITGTLSNPRAEVEAVIKKNGGIIVSSVSKNTDYLVTNDINSNSSKYIKAISLKIPIISQEALSKLIG